jgi:hypothetical protein
MGEDCMDKGVWKFKGDKYKYLKSPDEAKKGGNA